jgi:hypothetical protein
VGECYECRFNPRDPKQVTFFSDEELGSSLGGTIVGFMFLSCCFMPPAVIMFLGWWAHCGYASGWCCGGLLGGVCGGLASVGESLKRSPQPDGDGDGQRVMELWRRENFNPSASRPMSFIEADEPLPSDSGCPRSPLLSPAAGWVIMKDLSSGKAYYYNRSTNETSWVAPACLIGTLGDAPERKQEEEGDMSGMRGLRRQHSVVSSPPASAAPNGLRRNRSMLNRHHRSADVEPPTGLAGAGVRIRLARTNTIRAVGGGSSNASEVQLDLNLVRTSGHVEELQASLITLTRYGF